MEAGLGVAVVTARTAHLFPSRVRLKSLSVAPKPLCIAAGYREARADDKALDAQHHVPVPLRSAVVTRFLATTRTLTPTGPFAASRGSLIHVT